jgi:GDP-L-fucose synthase
MVGAALVRRLRAESCTILTGDRAELDLTRQAETERWIGAAKPDAVILAAGKVGGIAFNDRYRVGFLSDNLAIALNVICASHAAGVKKLLFLGSSCIYLKLAPQPMDEEMLLTGPLEPTNQWYAVAKIAGIKLVEAFRQQYGADFISVMPTNLYGPGDNYHAEHSHVPAALIRRLHEAKIAGAPTVTIWGTGRPRREFLAVDDLADACVFVLRRYSGSKFLNVGTGQDISIAEFAGLVAEVVGYRGRFVFDTSRPDGAEALECLRTHRAGLARQDAAEGRNCGRLLRFSRPRRPAQPSSASRRRKYKRVITLTANLLKDPRRELGGRWGRGRTTPIPRYAWAKKALLSNIGDDEV